MTRLLILLVTMTLATVPAVSLHAQQPQANSLRGAWMLSEVVEGPGSPNNSPTPSLFIFLDRHYSAMAVLGARPRFAPNQATDAEKLATYDAFAGHSGAYELNGTTVTMHPIVSKNEYMIGTSPRAEFKVEGDMLTWTVMLGATRGVSKYKRLE